MEAQADRVARFIARGGGHEPTAPR